MQWKAPGLFRAPLTIMSLIMAQTAPRAERGFQQRAFNKGRSTTDGRELNGPLTAPAALNVRRELSMRLLRRWELRGAGLAKIESAFRSRT
jgi:hypothetical protein